ncbi:MAG TPA: sugar ABC transporter permease [Inquilinus sp.]|nr:sugar ABC transporter permease [Inquilinus sp.]
MQRVLAWAARPAGRDGIAPYIFLVPILVVMLGLIAWPLLDSVATSLTDRSVGRPGRFVGLANFATLFADPVYLRAALNSLIITVAAVGLKLVIGVAAAVLLFQPMPLRGLVRALVFLPWAVPGLIAGLTWRWIYDEQVGILNFLVLASGIAAAPVAWLSDPTLGLTSIIIATVWHGLPFFIMMFLAGLSAIPRDLYEAAALDGAGAWRRFTAVTLPGLRDVIAITVMLSAIWTFNSFHMVFILTGGGPANLTHILPTIAYEYGIGRTRLGLGAAVMVSVMPLFIILISLLTRRMLAEKA